MDTNTVNAIGSVMAYYTTPVGTGPLIQNIAQGDAISMAIGAAQTAGGMIEMLGKQLPSMPIAGINVPAAALTLAGAGLMTDVANMNASFSKDGTISSSDIYSAAANISAVAGALSIAQAAAVAAGTTVAGSLSIPVLIGVAAITTLAGAALTVASMATNGSVDADALMNSLKQDFQELGNSLGDTYNEIANSIADTFVDLALDLSDAINTLGDVLIDAVVGLGAAILDFLISSAYGAEVSPISNDRYSAARGWIPRDPLAIDLDGDGIETVGIAGGVLFDHGGDGIKTGTGWVKSDDAFVVLDRNGNGSIDTGNELFGVDYVKTNGQKATNGFDALTDLDGNADGVFDAADAQYANVRLWRDHNQDGISQANELQSLSQAGITAIDLVAHTAAKNLGNGNTQILSADVAGIGTEAVALNLADNPFYREFTDHLDTTAVASLPDMQGSGRLRDLREAATLSTTLANQLADLQANYRTHDQFEAELETLIRNWADTSGWSTTPVDFQMPNLFGDGYWQAPAR